MKKLCYLTVIVLSLLFIGCGQRQGESDEVVILTLATFSDSAQLKKQVELFNQKQTGYCIEVKQYYRSERIEEDGVAKIQKEILSGKGPDIIHFGKDYSITDIRGNYTEDLYPYVEKLTQNSENEYFENIFEAFSYKNGLYAIPVDFSLETYAGSKSKAGDIKSVTIDELVNIYNEEKKKQDGNLMLYPGETKKAVFGSLIMYGIENYVDWEEGTVRFDSDEFRSVLEFSNQFPDRLVIGEDYSPMDSFANGEALLYPVSISNVYDICAAELVLKDDITYIGYPTQQSSGTVIEPGEVTLAISSGSEHKEIAWEFISQFLMLDYQTQLTDALPVHQKALEFQIENAMEPEFEVDDLGNQVMLSKSQIKFEGEEPIPIYQISKQQGEVLISLIKDAVLGASFDSTLHSILLEEAEGYFNGDKTVDETTKVMQGRALAYMGE